LDPEANPSPLRRQGARGIIHDNDRVVELAAHAIVLAQSVEEPAPCLRWLIADGPQVGVVALDTVDRLNRFRQHGLIVTPFDAQIEARDIRRGQEVARAVLGAS
jgi:hypothetical protein